MRLALHLALGFSVYVVRLERAKPLLLEFYGALGMDEDTAQVHMDRLAGKIFMLTALTSILAISLGYLVSRVSPGNAAGAAGS